MTQHTPAPWKIDAECSAVGNNFCIHDTVDNLHIAETLQIFGQDEANARLIAAAPELLEALEIVTRDLHEAIYTQAAKTWATEEIAYKHATALTEKYRVLIAKAKGE